MRKITEKFTAWCAEDTPAAKFERTVAQGLIGVACAALSAVAGAPEWVQVGVVPAAMAVLAPVQAWVGGKAE